MSRTVFTPTTVRVVAVGAAILALAGVAGVAVASDDESPRPAVTAATGKPHGTAADKPREAAALTGSAKLFRKTTEDVTFTFDAHLAAKNNTRPDKATGTFRFVHLEKPGGKGGWAKGRIDCLVTGGKVATATGIITGTNIKEMKGSRVGFSVNDRGAHDRLGYSWAATGGPDGTKKLTKCNSAAPFERVKQGTGDFHVLPWQVPYPTN
ncbi:Repetin [Streptomyces sp. NPDC059009]|uniref:Repetin n=1 Tax=Streptomyces sp. NPDC059009 TaxID=3346694 RepID=UPI0036B0D5AF